MSTRMVLTVASRRLWSQLRQGQFGKVSQYINSAVTGRNKLA